MELLGQLFLVMVILIIACAVSAGLMLLGVFGAMTGMVYGALALKRVLDFADTAVRTIIDSIPESPRHAARMALQRACSAWGWAVRTRLTAQRGIRIATRPVDRRLDAHPRAQWWVRLSGRWSLRLALVVGPLAACIAWYVYNPYGKKPDLAVITGWQPPVIGHLYDRKGLVVMRAFHEARVLIGAREFADPRYDTARNALVASEDQRFWDHDGVDWTATVWTGLKNLVGLSDRGASSIDQQNSRNIYPALQEIVAKQKSGELTVDNTFTRILASVAGPTRTNKAMRKLPEIRSAVWTHNGLKQHLGSERAAKELTVAIYANFVNLGDGVYGVEYGARNSFCKGADELEPHEAAYLASLIPLPNVYCKARKGHDIQGAISRRNHVLKRMAESGFITWEQFGHYRTRPLGFCSAPQGPKTEAPAAVKMALGEMTRISKEYTSNRLHNGDFQLGLTIDMDIQRGVNRSARRHIFGDPEDKLPGFAGKYPGAKTPQVAVVVMRPTGEILAMHGGFTEGFYGYTEHNTATESYPPMGSTYKTVDMVTAVTAGVHPDDIVYDQRVCVRKNLAGGLHCFDNYKNEYQGAVPFREASAQSLNGAFMWTMLNRGGGAKATIAWARELGITSRLEPYPPTILGSNGVRPIEVAKVFARLGSGIKTEPFVIQRITTRDGSNVFEKEVRPQQLMLPGTSQPVPAQILIETRQLLRGNVRLPKGTARGLNDTAKFPVEVACKTGTANEHRAAWIGCFTGGVDGVVVVAWAGHKDYSPLPHEGLPIHMKASGGSVLGPMVREIFLGLYGTGKPLGTPPSMPAEVEAPIDAYLGLDVPMK